MRIAVITGGRDRTPTITELEDALARLGRRAVDVVRHGDCRGTDKAVAAYLKSRTELAVEAWPAWPDFGTGPSAGPRRNRAMLDGTPPPRRAARQGGLFGVDKANTDGQKAEVLIAFRGGDGTRDCTQAALGERWMPVEWIPDADEPRPWNRHAGEAPRPSDYIGRGTPLGNPFTIAQHGEAALELYRRRLWDMLRDRHPPVMQAMEAITDEHHLVCSCWPRPCHAEVVIAAWRWLRKTSPAGPVETA